MTCRPTVSTGLRLVMGSWKIIAISRPRMARMPSSGRPTRLRPPNMTRPETWATRGGSRPMMASELTDLPQPDSPTRATISPRSTL